MTDTNAQPPADALLWRVQGVHHEVFCYVVATEGGVVLCVASDGEDDLLVAEAYSTLGAATDRAAVLRASLITYGLLPSAYVPGSPAEGTAPGRTRHPPLAIFTCQRALLGKEYT